MSPPTVDIPIWARLCLAHAVVEHVARAAGVDLLHIKGPATDAVLRTRDRLSSDVDVLVRPVDVDALITALQAVGFELRTHFETGSIFRHAANLHHRDWGWVDVHRSFPGIGAAPAPAFQRLRDRRRNAEIAAYDVPVPALLDQALLIVLHGARDTGRGREDIEHVRTALTAAQWDQVVGTARVLNADVAFAAGAGDLADYRDRPEHDLWQVVSRGGTRSQEWRARLRAASGTAAKAQILGEALFTNRDHLRMELGHEPSMGERLRAEAHRLVVAGGGAEGRCVAAPRPEGAVNGAGYAVPDSVAWVREDTGDQVTFYVAVMDGSAPMVLDGSGALIWQLACEVPRADIAIQVSEITGEPVAAVSDAVTDFLTDLTASKLLAPLHPLG